MTTPANPPEGQAASVPLTNATSTGSATGAQLAAASKQIPTGDDRGSKVPIKGDPKDSAPQGAQAEPARFGTNGSLPHRTVGSPSGPVPVGALKGSKESVEAAAEANLAAHDAFVAERNARDRRLTDAEINRVSAAELRAIGAQRGYKLSDYAGVRVVRTQFTDLQAKDGNLPTEK